MPLADLARLLVLSHGVIGEINTFQALLIDLAELGSLTMRHFSCRRQKAYEF